MFIWYVLIFPVWLIDIQKYYRSIKRQPRKHTRTHTHTYTYIHIHTRAPMIVLLGAHTSTRPSLEVTQWYIKVSPWHFGFVSHIFSFALFSKAIVFSGQASTLTRAAFVSLHTWFCNRTNHWFSYIKEICYQTLVSILM